MVVNETKVVEAQPLSCPFYCAEISMDIFSSPEPKAQGELIVRDSSRRPSVRACVRASTLSNMNISESSRPILIKGDLAIRRIFSLVDMFTKP